MHAYAKPSELVKKAKVCAQIQPTTTTTTTTTTTANHTHELTARFVSSPLLAPLFPSSSPSFPPYQTPNPHRSQNKRHKDQEWETPSHFKPDPKRVEAKREVPAAWDSTRPYVTWAASSEGMAAHKTRHDKRETSKVGNRSMSTKYKRGRPGARPASPARQPGERVERADDRVKYGSFAWKGGDGGGEGGGDGSDRPAWGSSRNSRQRQAMAEAGPHPRVTQTTKTLSRDVHADTATSRARRGPAAGYEAPETSEQRQIVNMRNQIDTLEESQRILLDSLASIEAKLGGLHFQVVWGGGGAGTGWDGVGRGGVGWGSRGEVGGRGVAVTATL